MATLAKGLEIVFSIEQPIVTLVGNDMVNLARRSPALPAFRVLGKHGCP
jgi:hypothetical protein